MAIIGHGPFCAMLIADLAAEVIRIRRSGGAIYDTGSRFDVTARGHRFVELDLRQENAARRTPSKSATAD